MKESMHKFRPEVREYVCQTSLRKPVCLDELMAATNSQTEHPMMATDPEQAQFLAFLIRATGAKRIVEVGVFTGVGTLWMADAAGSDGQVIACDITDEYPAIGTPFWEKAGVRERIDLRIGSAEKSLAALLESEGPGCIDFCYIDADKEAYKAYYELVIQLLRPGGIVAFDNMLQGGRVADPAIDEPQVNAIRELNAMLHTDERVDVSFLPICDGLYLARKR